MVSVVIKYIDIFVYSLSRYVLVEKWLNIILHGLRKNVSENITKTKTESSVIVSQRYCSSSLLTITCNGSKKIKTQDERFSLFLICLMSYA